MAVPRSIPTSSVKLISLFCDISAVSFHFISSSLVLPPTKNLHRNFKGSIFPNPLTYIVLTVAVNT